MNVWHVLILISCFSSTLTLLIVALAVLPQLKQGMAVVRDAILWAALVVLLAGGAYWAWQHWDRGTSGPSTRPVSARQIP